jgi:ankyrin repeat protein
MEGDIDTTELLLSERAGMNNLDYTNSGALMHSCHRGHLDVVECLLYKGANIHIVNNNGEACFPVARNCSNLSDL